MARLAPPMCKGMCGNNISPLRKLPRCLPLGSNGATLSFDFKLGWKRVSTHARASSSVCMVISVGPGSSAMIHGSMPSSIVVLPLPTGAITTTSLFSSSAIHSIGSRSQGVASMSKFGLRADCGSFTYSHAHSTTSMSDGGVMARQNASSAMPISLSIRRNIPLSCRCNMPRMCLGC